MVGLVTHFSKNDHFSFPLVPMLFAMDQIQFHFPLIKEVCELSAFSILSLNNIIQCSCNSFDLHFQFPW